MTAKILSSEKGLVLVVSLLLMAVLLVISSIAMTTTSIDLKITGNFKSNKKALYTAEAGVEEVRARMRGGAVYPIVDNHPANPGWSLFIGSAAGAQSRGYESGNSAHILTGSVHPQWGYEVKAVHQRDGGGNLLYWGDANGDGVNERTTTFLASMKNIYLVASEAGYAGSNRVIEAEIAKMPPINVPAALYVDTAATVQGTSTNIIGTDECGSADLPGILTPQAPGNIGLNGNPNIAGAGGATPNIAYNGTPVDVQNLINLYKGMADFHYAVSDVTHSGTTVPGPGDGWGTPVPGATLQDPSSCNSSKIVYYEAGGTDVRMSGGVSGCGILLVEGNLALSGSFSWYGVVLTSGSISFTGGGNKNITGAVLSKGTAESDLVGGNANIVYCSAAVRNQTEYMPLQILSWRDNPAP